MISPFCQAPALAQSDQDLHLRTYTVIMSFSEAVACNPHAPALSQAAYWALPHLQSSLQLVLLLTLIAPHPSLISGTLPMEWSRWSELDTLQLWGNQLTGSLPSKWSHMQHLTYLDLSSNNLTGLAALAFTEHKAAQYTNFIPEAVLCRIVTS